MLKRRKRGAPRTTYRSGRRSLWKFRHPAQLVVVAFLMAILVGALLLSVPFAREGPGAAPALTALFTATSAVCVTGLIVVDTAAYWSSFGEAVILVLIQVGGFGIMTIASLLALFVYRNLGLWGRLVAQTETKTFELGNVRRVLVNVALFSLTFEAIAAAYLTFRLWSGYQEPILSALYRGIFHAVSAFNNAGFALYEDSLSRFVSDWGFSLTVLGAVILGGVGFPVLLELKRVALRPARWSLHTKLTLAVTGALLVLGPSLVLLFEWTNPATIGDMSVGKKLLAGFFQGVTPRTAGFNTLDYSAMNETTWLSSIVLMFIGGGSGGTAGGVKVTTIAIIIAMVWAETRGDPTVDLMNRRVAGPAQRQALAVVVGGTLFALVGTILIMSVGGFDLSRAMFEAFSAFGTVGLSTGITSELPDAGRIIVIVLMFVGRLGPITLATALALREHRQLYRLPEERPIVG